MNWILNDIKKKMKIIMKDNLKDIKKINKEDEYEYNICPEKCSICQRSKCQEESCKYNFNIKLGHESIHTCNHRHQCINDCSFKNFSSNCYLRCKLEYGHDGKHNCGAMHYCKQICDFFGRARNCLGNCVLLYPHQGLHNCGTIHICDKECYLYGKSKVCKKIM